MKIIQFMVILIYANKYVFLIKLLQFQWQYGMFVRKILFHYQKNTKKDVVRILLFHGQNVPIFVWIVITFNCNIIFYCAYFSIFCANNF